MTSILVSFIIGLWICSLVNHFFGSGDDWDDRRKERLDMQTLAFNDYLKTSSKSVVSLISRCASVAIPKVF